MRAAEVYVGSDGEVTKAYYAELEKRGPLGIVAMNLFRAQKCSHRAKLYRRRAHKDEAYGRKTWSMQQLCDVLARHGAELGTRYGWKKDPKEEYASWVLYVDLPQGQVSFHNPACGLGPVYAGEWDGQHKSAERVIAFCDSVFNREHSALSSQQSAEPFDAEESVAEAVIKTFANDVDKKLIEQASLFTDVRSES